MRDAGRVALAGRGAFQSHGVVRVPWGAYANRTEIEYRYDLRYTSAAAASAWTPRPRPQPSRQLDRKTLARKSPLKRHLPRTCTPAGATTDVMRHSSHTNAERFTSYDTMMPQFGKVKLLKDYMNDVHGGV